MAVGSLGLYGEGQDSKYGDKDSFSDSFRVPTLVYAGETWTCNKAESSRVQVVELSYFRGACGLSKMDGKSSERMYGKLCVI